MEKIRFLLADDHPTFREGLSRLLNDEEDFECVAQAADGFEAVNLSKELKKKWPKDDGNVRAVCGLKLIAT